MRGRVVELFSSPVRRKGAPAHVLFLFETSIDACIFKHIKTTKFECEPFGCKTVRLRSAEASCTLEQDQRIVRDSLHPDEVCFDELQELQENEQNVVDVIGKLEQRQANQ